MKPVIKILLDTRRKKTNTGKYPVKLRVNFVKEQKYYALNLDLTKEEYTLMQNPGAISKDLSGSERKVLKEWKLKCDAVLVKAHQICDQIPEFSYPAFEKKMFQPKSKETDVYSRYLETIARLKSELKLGTASNYQCSLNSLKTFKPKLNLKDISVDFLKAYERWLLDNNKSISTVGIYLRPLRAVINEAISEGIISHETNYPFGKRKYQIPASRNIKKALSLTEITMIRNYKAEQGSWAEKARDFFIFSYLCNGINIKDIALLKYKNIDGDLIHFNRAKTKHTSRTTSKPISIYILKEVQEIIERWRNVNTEKEDFLFPILEAGLSAQREQRLIQQFTKMVNKYIKIIATNLGINKQVTSYFARHSYATILRNSGAPTAFISESLGHTNIKTTASYLDSFESDTKKEWAKALLDVSSKLQD